jgi:hypothetical protein
MPNGHLELHPQSSTSAPQIVHADDSDRFLLLSIPAVRMELKTKRQIKILILGGTFKFHNYLQYFLLEVTSEEFAFPS